MKTHHDWSFTNQEKSLPKPALQENKVFHALTAAHAKNKELEVYAATENIMRREKELCQMAIRDLQGLASGQDQDGTVKMILEHYQSRMQVTSEKESKLKQLSEDSKKLNEEYRKKNQELAEVKRNLMESQSKLRELAKVTDKLSKKEEELRFIEGHLAEELEKNRHEMLNGLYEIVAEFSEGGEGNPLGSKSTLIEQLTAEVKEAKENGVIPDIVEKNIGTTPDKTLFASPNPEKDLPKPPNLSTPPISTATSPTDPRRLQQLLTRSQRIQVLEPPKSFCSKSLVKSPEGKLLCEYFYPTQAPRDARQYVFNTVYTLNFLLDTLDKEPSAFPKRLELAFGDLSSRLDHSQNIHLEAACKDLFNRESLSKFLALGIREKPTAFLELAENCIHRFEAMGPKRVDLIEHQFEAFNPIP